MKITSAEYIKSAVFESDYPVWTGSEIAFVGRSNVGKSSLINSLMCRKRLAHTSSSPGRTQTLNFYLVNDFIYLVDLPGYGFTKAPESVSQKWRQAIDRYLTTRSQLMGCIHLVDIRHSPSAMDVRVSHWLREMSLLCSTIAVKIDKISRNAAVQALHSIRTNLELRSDDLLIGYSSLTHVGRDELWKVMNDRCAPSLPDQI